MAWRTLAQGNTLEEFQGSSPPVSELPKGTKLRLTLEMPWYAPIAPLADLWGAEWVAQRMLEEGVIVEDVEGIGLNTIVVHMRAASPVVPIIWAIVAIIGLITIAIIVIKLEGLLPELPPELFEAIKWVAIAIITLAGIKVITRPKREAKVK